MRAAEGSQLYVHELERGLVVRSARLASPLGLEPATFDLARVAGSPGAVLVVVSGEGASTRGAMRVGEGVECELPLSGAAKIVRVDLR